MKVFTVVGARPQFIKAAPMSAALRRRHQEILVHTGQHYDYGMSDVFFAELRIPRPAYNLGVGSGPHGWQTGQMLEKLEALLLQEQPDWVLVYGDTNSTLAGGLAAAKLNIPLAHVEAGLRSFNWTMPEEINRVLTDRCSQLLFCPTKTAVGNLHREGIAAGVHQVGDIMYDALLYYLPLADEERILVERQLKPKEFVLATVHRAANTDRRTHLEAVLACLAASPWPVLLPIHPRTQAALARFGLTVPENVTATGPVGYLEMLALEKNARLIMTDSGGVQKEAYLLSTPCITLRPETEWVETVTAGWNVIVDRDVEKVRDAFNRPVPQESPPPVFGNGQSVTSMVRLLEEQFGEG